MSEDRIKHLETDVAKLKKENEDLKLLLRGKDFFFCRSCLFDFFYSFLFGFFHIFFTGEIQRIEMLVNAKVQTVEQRLAITDAQVLTHDKLISVSQKH